MIKSALLLLFLATVSYADPIKVAIIDTGLDLHDDRFSTVLCQDGHKDFTGEGIEDRVGHGTHVAGLVMQYAKDSNYCIVILKYYVEADSVDHTMQDLLAAYRYAATLGVKFVNLSSGGDRYNREEAYIIKHHPEITFVVAAGNEHRNIDLKGKHYYPASLPYSNIISVGNGTLDHPYWSSNYGNSVKAWELGDHVYSTLPGGSYGCMTGTSMSTAILTGKLISTYETAH